MSRKRFWLYGRVASPDNYALSYQMEYLQHFAETWQLNVVGASQNETSGLTFDRPGLNQFLEKVKQRLVDALLVKDLSRLGRNYIEVQKLLDDLKAKGIEVFSISDMNLKAI